MTKQEILRLRLILEEEKFTADEKVEKLLKVVNEAAESPASN